MRTIFGKKSLQKAPEVLTQPENPVNYKSVLDYLVGLSKPEYDRMLKVSGIYRTANKNAAKVLGVKDEPTHQLLSDEPTQEQIDAGIDEVLGAPDGVEFYLDDMMPLDPTPKKAQSSSKKVEVKKG